MTLEALQALLMTLGVPVSYRQSADETKLPRIVFRDYLVMDDRASGQVFRRTRHVDIGLYTNDLGASWADRVHALLVQAGLKPRETIRDEAEPRSVLHAWEVQWDEQQDV